MCLSGALCLREQKHPSTSVSLGTILLAWTLNEDIFKRGIFIIHDELFFLNSGEFFLFTVPLTVAHLIGMKDVCF